MGWTWRRPPDVVRLLGIGALVALAISGCASSGQLAKSSTLSPTARTSSTAAGSQPAVPASTGAAPPGMGAGEDVLAEVATWVDSDGARIVLRWNPCSPIGVRLNLGRVPLGEQGAVRAEILQALRETAAATGLDYQVGPDTQEVPTLEGDNATADLVIAVVDATRGDLLAGGEEIGHGVYRYWAWDGAGTQPGGAVIGRGAVMLNRDDYLALAPGPGPGLSRRNVLLHELGHTLALRHRPGTLMAANLQDSDAQGWTPADLAVLAALGRGGGCVAIPVGVLPAIT